MALKPTDARHAAQINAGTIGRKKGHSFEELLAKEIRDFPRPFRRRDLAEGHLFLGNPALHLINFILHDIDISHIDELNSVSPGTLATSEVGEKTIDLKGVKIGRSKSDILILGVVKRKDFVAGVSVKQCTNDKPTNAQLYFTTARAFCDLLRRNSIDVSDDALTALRMFCGDDGFRPLDNMTSLKGRKTDPRRWFWEELPRVGREELEKVLSDYQDKVTRLLLQQAYANDPFPPDYVAHQTKKFANVHSCEVAIYSIDQLIKLSHKYGGFNKKLYSVRKGQHKDPPGVHHEAPRFGIVQMQRGGQKQHPTQLQFNLEAGYFYKIPKSA